MEASSSKAENSVETKYFVLIASTLSEAIQWFSTKITEKELETPKISQMLESIDRTNAAVNGRLVKIEMALHTVPAPVLAAFESERELASSRVDDDIALITENCAAMPTDCTSEDIENYLSCMVMSPLLWVYSLMDLLYDSIISPTGYISHEEQMRFAFSFASIPLVPLLQKMWKIILRAEESGQDLFKLTYRLCRSVEAVYRGLHDMKDDFFTIWSRKCFPWMLDYWLPKIIVARVQMTDVLERTAGSGIEGGAIELTKTSYSIRRILFPRQRPETEILPRFDKIPISQLLVATDQLTSTMCRLYSDKSHEDMATNIRILAQQISDHLSTIRSIHRGWHEKGDNRELHRHWCYAVRHKQCQLTASNHYFVPNIDVHILDVTNIVRFLKGVRNLITMANTTQTEEQIDEKITLLVRIMENFCKLLQAETQFSNKGIVKKRRKFRSEMAAADLRVAEYSTELAILLLIVTADVRGLEDMQVMTHIKELYELTRNLNEIARDNPVEFGTTAHSLAADRLREILYQCQRAGKDIESEQRKDPPEFEIVQNEWCRTLRRIARKLQESLIALICGEEGIYSDAFVKLMLGDATNISGIRNSLSTKIGWLPLSELLEFVRRMPESEDKEKSATSAAEMSELVQKCRARILQLPIPAIAFNEHIVALCFANVAANLRVLLEKFRPLPDVEITRPEDEISRVLKALNLRFTSLLDHITDIECEGFKTDESDLKRSWDGVFYGTPQFKNKMAKSAFVDANKEFIGNGSYGKVFKVHYKKRGITAVKQIAIDMSDESVTAITNEIAALKKLRHPGVVRIYRSWFDHSAAPVIKADDSETGSSSQNHSLSDESRMHKHQNSYAHVSIEMAFYARGTLKDWLSINSTQEQRSIKQLKEWLAQLCHAMDYVHRQGLIHRDLKPGNIFTSEQNQLVIGDFGLVSISETSQSSTTRSALVGTEKYMAPEQITANYNNKVDVYALGQIYFDMVFVGDSWMGYENVEPFGSANRSLDEYQEAFSMYRWLTTFHPSERPSCYEVLQSAYFDVDDYLALKFSLLLKKYSNPATTNQLKTTSHRTMPPQIVPDVNKTL